jgi:hypothetical protein
MKLLIAASCAGLLMASSAFGATVTNGSFETGTVTLTSGYGIASSYDGWTVGPAGVEIQEDGAISQIDAQDGERYVELDTTVNSFISQSISFSSAGEYLLSFWYSSIRNNDGITAEIGGVSQNYTTIGSSNTAWQLVTMAFTSDGSTPQTLKFSATGPSGGIGGLLDNVSITQTSVVPLPATGLMLLGALGGFAALRRRKDKKAV